MFGPFGPFGMQFNLPEFIAGVAAGLVLAFLAIKLKPVFGWIADPIRSGFESLRARVSARAIDRYQLELITRAETMHLARPIFALDEILLTPRVLAPPQPTDPTKSDGTAHDTLAVVPNLPDATYLSALYAAHTLSLPDALMSSPHLLLTGEPGSGKTTALAYLAIRLANRHAEVAKLGGLIPIFIHALDLELQKRTKEEPLEPLISAGQQTASSGVAAMMPGYIRRHFGNGKAILLVDGLDELASNEISAVAEWLGEVRKAYPDIRIVAAGAPMGYDGLIRVGLAPVFVAPWTDHDQRTFLTKWSQSWQEFVVPHLPRGRLADLDPAMMTGWLTGAFRGATPAQMTLRTWAAFAGDVRGQRAADHYKSYAARLLSQDERSHVERVALSWIEGGQGAVAERALPRGTPVADLIEAGILIKRAGGRIAFAQLSVGAYFAARAMADHGPIEAMLVSSWPPVQKAMQFLAVLSNAEAAVHRLINTAREPLKLELLTCARWLPDSPSQAAWRGDLLREIAILIQDASNPYGLRLRALHAITQSGEASANILFQRMLRSERASSRVLAALGLGGLTDEDSVERLVKLINQDKALLVRQAACLALAAIGNDAALEGLGRALLESDEAVRLAAAEALAAHPTEGYTMLREAAEHDALLTRRAAVFGLARIPEPWVEEVLEKVQLDDQQWVVRGAAAEALEQRRNPPWIIPTPPSDLTKLDWLVAFAAREGLGVAPGRGALEMLRQALSKGSTEEQIAAIETLAWGGGEDLNLELYQALRSQDDYLRDSAYETLWRMAAMGIQLPSPMKFGM